MTKVELDAIGTSTTLESNKSLLVLPLLSDIFHADRDRSCGRKRLRRTC